MSGPEVQCMACGSALPAADAPCPCGSGDRLIGVSDEAVIDDAYWLIHERHAKTRSPRSGKPRPGLERTRGYEPSEGGGFAWLEERLVDRDNNLYRERGVDAHGQPFSSEEPLDQHRGHGSAKLGHRTRRPG